MTSYNPFQSIFRDNNNTNTTSTNSNSLFGANNNNNNNKPLFGANNNTSINTATFGVNNANNGNISSLLGTNNTSTNNTSPLFGANNTNNAANPNNNNQNSLFSNPNQNSLFGTNNNNNNNNNASNTFFGVNNNTNNNNIQSNNIFFGINNQNQNNISQINQIGNLSGINNNQNNNNMLGNNNFNINQPNNILNQNQYYADLNKRQNDYREYQQVLVNIENCCNPSKLENMFKDYLYLPIKKGQQPSEVNVYRPYTTNKNNEPIINDFNIWEEGNKKNKNPNEYFTVQISSVDGLLFRNKLLENRILKSIAQTVENEKSLELLNKKIEDEMNSKLMDIKNCHLKLDELELNLSSKVAQYNYLIGTAKENVSATQEIKDNIKKTNDIIEQNNMIELCEKIKKSSSENFSGENHNYIKDMNKEKINSMLDALVEIQNMMNVICNNNKKNLDILNGMQKEVDRILKKNEI